jgi:amidase
MNLSGMLPQAPSSDTMGWFSLDAKTFAAVSSVLLGEAAPTALPSKLLIAVDAFGFAREEVRSALSPLVKKLSTLIGDTRDEVMALQGLSAWGRAQRTLQPAEAWETFKYWIDRVNPRLAFNVARGLLAGSATPGTALQWARLMRREARARLEYLLPPGTILCLPTTPFPAPEKGLPLTEKNRVREEILCLCAHGGLAGVPQISIPGAIVDEAPVGLSIIGGRGQDASLVAVATAMENR